MSSKIFVVIGATGKQGSAVLSTLTADPRSSGSAIYAVHHSPASAGALRAKYPSVKPIQGDITDSDAIFKSVSGTPDAIYFMTPNGKSEVEQGKAIISAAVRAGTRHIVMSSVDRGEGGNVRSGVEHWDTKHEIEAFLRQQKEITYTIIRPTAFLENFAPGFNGKVFASVWRDYLGDKTMKLVSTRDIGISGANAMAAPEDFRNAEINLAGDELTFEEANRIFSKQTGGKPLPTAGKFLTWALVSMIKDLKQMAGFLNEKGYGAVPNRDLTSWETWVAQSEFAAGGKA